MLCRLCLVHCGRRKRLCRCPPSPLWGGMKGGGTSRSGLGELGHENSNTRRRHRGRGRRLLGAVSPGQGRLDRHHADRALGADVGLVLARGGRLPHAERRPERRQAAGLYGRALQGTGGDFRPVLRAAPDRRRDAGGKPGADGLPAWFARQGPASRHADGADHAAGSQGDVPADGRDEFRRRAVGPGGGPSRPVRDDACLCEGGPRAGRGDRLAQPGQGTDTGRRRHLERRHRTGDGAVRACRQCRRAVGARGRPDGRAGTAAARHGAHVSADRGHAGGDRIQPDLRARTDPRDGFPRRDLHKAGTPGHAARHLRAGVQAMVASRDAVGFRP